MKLFSKRYRLPTLGQKIKITWLPDNRGEKNAYIGMEGIVVDVDDDGFELRTETSILICGNKVEYDLIT